MNFCLFNGSLPNTHGEDKYIVMFSGMHIEMAMWKTYGDYLELSGWTNARTHRQALHHQAPPILFWSYISPEQDMLTR